MLDPPGAMSVSFAPQHATFLAYTAPGAGQVFPLVPGLLALRERGHDVHLRTAPDLVAAIRRVGLAVGPVDPRLRQPWCRERAGERLPSPALERWLIEQRDLEDAVAEIGPHALLVDASAPGAVIAARASGIPRALTLTSLLQSPHALDTSLMLSARRTECWRSPASRWSHHAPTSPAMSGSSVPSHGIRRLRSPAS